MKNDLIWTTQLIPLPVPLGGTNGALSLDDERRRPADTLDADRLRLKAAGASFDADCFLAAMASVGLTRFYFGLIVDLSHSFGDFSFLLSFLSKISQLEKVISFRVSPVTFQWTDSLIVYKRGDSPNLVNSKRVAHYLSMHTTYYKICSNLVAVDHCSVLLF